MAANRGVRGDVGADGVAAAGGDSERGFESQRGQFTSLQGIDPGQRRQIAQSIEKIIQGCSIALNLDIDACAVVANPTAQAALDRQPVDERAEADALHLAANLNRSALERGHSLMWKLAAK